MSDLISRKAAMDVFMGKPPDFYHTSYIVGEINCLPSVKDVPVVRCRECKYWETDWKPNHSIDGEHFCPMISLVTSGGMVLRLRRTEG